MKQNIKMIVTKLYEKPIIDSTDIISNDDINNEFSYTFLNIKFKYLFEDIQDMYSSIHIYVIFIFLIILILIFIFQNNDTFNYYLYN
jgi:uncharacterized integral membrane protein